MTFEIRNSSFGKSYLSMILFRQIFMFELGRDQKIYDVSSMLIGPVFYKSTECVIQEYHKCT